VSLGLLEPPMNDDLDARRMLQCAQGAFQKWPEGFAGFSATIRCSDGDNAADGMVTVLAGGRVEVDLAAAAGALVSWVRDALAAISAARTPQFFKHGDGRFPITFEAEDQHPLGRGVRVHLGGTRWRTYRIDGKGRIRQQENAEPATRATVAYEDFMRACPGRVLPIGMHLINWDIVTQSITETADVDDTYERHQHMWLPLRRRATLVSGRQRRERSFELSCHRLL
jgi:hypothetical protein